MSNSGMLVYENKREVLQWFNNFLNSASSNFKTSTLCFKNYYEKCVNDMVRLPFKREMKSDIAVGQLDAIYTEDIEDFKSSCTYNRVLEKLQEDVDFLAETIEFGLVSKELAEVIKKVPYEKLSKMTKEEVSLMISDPNYIDYVNSGTVNDVIRDSKITDEIVDENLVSLLKVHRLSNLEVKLVHTARIVYLTNLEVDKLGIKDDLVKSILYTGALFHDVGRFYQGAYYNSYAEGDLKRTENQMVSDHAEAGYYYSLLDMINLNVLGAATNEDLIVHALAAVVVRKHQRPNSELSDYDKKISDLNFDSNVKQELLNFVLSCYGEASKFKDGLHGRFNKVVPGAAESMRQSYTDSIVNIISAYTGEKNLDGIRNVIYNLITYETPDLVLDADNINILRQCLIGEELALLEKKVASGESVLLSPEYNKVIRSYKLGSYLGENSKVVNEFVTNLIDAGNNTDYYSQYDIVSIIDKVMEANSQGDIYKGINIPEDVSKVIRMSMALVMDADKLDILVQRAVKSFPNWKPTAVNIKALKNGEVPGLFHDESIVDVLEGQFKVNIRYDEEGRIVLDDALIGIIKHNANINGQFKKKFGENFDFNSLKSGRSLDDIADNAMKDSFEGKIVSVPYDLMAKVHPDLMERYSLEMNMILPPDLRENVFKEDEDRRKAVGSNGAETAFPLGVKASEDKRFVWNNVFPAIWWHFDQFIMTNMRSTESLRFISETGLLDRIVDTYSNDDFPEECSMFLDEIVDFSKEFIALALSAKVNTKGDIIFDEEQHDGYSPIVLSDKETMLRIRNEAATRRYEKMKKEEQTINNEVGYVGLEKEHSSQLHNMFDGSSSDSVDEKFLDVILEQLVEEGTKNTTSISDDVRVAKK